MDVKDVVKRINLSFKLSNIVITGGEPLLQQDSLVLLLTLLKSRNRENEFDYGPYRIEIETNGTIRPKNELVKLIDQWNVSPKTSNSFNETQGINLEIFYDRSLPHFRNLENAFFKFIVDKPEDIKEIDEMIKKYELPNKRVILMPQATTKDDLLKKSMWLEKFAKENGYTMSTRLHVLLWQNQRAK
jgi:organic radical activating enzyme